MAKRLYVDFDGCIELEIPENMWDDESTLEELAQRAYFYLSCRVSSDFKKEFPKVRVRDVIDYYREYEVQEVTND